MESVLKLEQRVKMTFYLNKVLYVLMDFDRTLPKRNQLYIRDTF